MHIHRNEPGVLQALNNLFSSAGINIVSQYCRPCRISVMW